MKCLEKSRMMYLLSSISLYESVGHKEMCWISESIGRGNGVASVSH